MTNTINNKLINALSSISIKNQLSQYLTDDKLSFTETKQLFTSIEQGGMTATKLKDLNTLWLNNTSLFSDDYTKAITGYVITGCNANSFWWGGLNNIDKTILGNLNTTTSQDNLEKLINKWFVGTDVPMALVGGDTAAGISGNYSFNYGYFSSGVLYKEGVSASDVNQGKAGTCYYLACLGAVANANPSFITKDFIRDNGDGTYGFRFFNVNNEAYYVTVDKNLAIDKKTNQPVLANPSNGELWVALAEKAYAQINSQSNVLLRNQSDNSYQAIEGGNADPLKQITGLNFRIYSGFYENVSSIFSYADTKYSLYSQDSKTYKNEIISLLQNGSIGTFSVTEKINDKNGNRELFPGHAFMLLGYDAKTDTFKIRNPWGDHGNANETIANRKYVPEFNLPIESFWNISSIKLTDASLKNPTYSYTIKPDTGTSKDNAISEGQSAYLTVLRDTPNMSSIIYYSTQPNSTQGLLDQPILSKVAIDFRPGETVKHFSIPIYTDSIQEDIESFDVNFYKSFFDTTPFTNTTLFIKDGNLDKSTYILTNVDSEIITEGQIFKLQIKRSDSSTPSTVYIDTIDKTAIGTDINASGNYTVLDSDYIKLHKIPVNFKIGQNTATIDIDTLSDFKIEGTETFRVNLYKYFTDINAVANGTIQIADHMNASYHYSMTSDADSEMTAKDEGDSITYTVKRDGTGTESSIFITSEIGSAFEGVDYLFEPIELKFSSNQDTLTFNVDTLPDNQFEATELLNIGLRTTPTSTSPIVTVSGYIKNVDEVFYNYDITCSAPNSDLPTKEGDDIVFTITRDKSGTESTIYVDTFDGLAISDSGDGTSDYEGIYSQEVTFAANETAKEIVVKTFADSDTTEGIEDFNLGIYNFESDATYLNYTTAYIEDMTPDNYSYSFDEDEYDVIEGNQLTITITRSSTGTPSTVFLWTNTEIATEEDYETVDGLEIDFDTDETVTTVVINTIDDALTDETIYENFGLYLSEYYDSDSYLASSEVWIQSNSINEIYGSDENDTLIGTNMQDYIYGFEGNDKITGGSGQDILTGGDGKDIFIFTSIDDSLPYLMDIVLDFTKGDKIDLRAIDANIATSKDNAFSKPTIGDQFSGMFAKPGQLFFDTTDEILYGNVDGDGGADFAITLTSVTKLVANDFIL